MTAPILFRRAGGKNIVIRHFTMLATLLGLTFIFGLSGHASSLPAPMGTGVSGTLIADTTWTAAGNPYVLDG